MTTFITRLDDRGTGPRLAVKDIIDVAGVPTTAGSRAVERRAQPAVEDARCLRGAREAGARLVGKANLHELAMLPLGTNPWFGTPVNPLDAALIPGGSSSGSAVAVADGEADVALGSDTGGSIRVPAACCGVAGLKTTHGRVSLDGVWPLAPSLDTIGPMAVDVAGLELGMRLLEPDFAPAPAPARVIGRLRTFGDPAIEQAVDEALKAADFEVVSLDWEELEAGTNLWTPIYFSEMWEVDHEVVDSAPDCVGPDIAATVAMAEMFKPALSDARKALPAWRQSLLSLFDRVELLALPTLPIFPPRLDEISADTVLPLSIELTKHVSAFNAAGTPCTAQPVPVRGERLPASIQLVALHRGEELLLATARRLEEAVTR